MKKFVALFTDSYKELKSVRTITTAAMFAAVAIILGYFSINIGNMIRIGFSSIPNGLMAYLFGPVVGGIFAGTLDVLKYLMQPVGVFFPGLTLVVILAGVLYGCLYYKRNITLPRVFAARFIVMMICNVWLNTWCLSVMYGDAFMAILPARLVKNLIMLPVDSMIFYSIAKSLETLGVLRTIKSFTVLRAK